jgi:hypothetical protein
MLSAGVVLISKAATVHDIKAWLPEGLFLAKK